MTPYGSVGGEFDIHGAKVVELECLSALSLDPSQDNYVVLSISLFSQLICTKEHLTIFCLKFLAKRNLYTLRIILCTLR